MILRDRLILTGSRARRDTQRRSPGDQMGGAITPFKRKDEKIWHSRWRVPSEAVSKAVKDWQHSPLNAANILI